MRRPWGVYRLPGLSRDTPKKIKKGHGFPKSPGMPFCFPFKIEIFLSFTPFPTIPGFSC